MKRMHVHVSVESLEKAVHFYSALFGAQPTKLKTDYAKWMLEEPRLNFAISAQGRAPGVDHFGIQVEDEAELKEVRSRIEKANLGAFDEGETTCCYAKSDKTWVLDPAGMPWEAYQTMQDAEVFHGAPSEVEKAPSRGCCG